MTIRYMTLGDVVQFLPEARLLNIHSETMNQVLSKLNSDSRNIQAGELFIALKGEKFDGNQFLDEARVKGASAALASNVENLKSDLPVVLVENTLQAMQTLARLWRLEINPTVAVITGSNGKTTVKEMIASIFSVAAGNSGCLATQGNFNNEIGLPLTLLRLTSEHRLAAIELGMNHPGETQELAAIAAPNIALINNAQREHQEFMNGVEAVAKEHATVIDALGNDGIAVFPAESEYAELWRAHAGNREVIDFALNGNAIVTGNWSGSGRLQITINRQIVKTQENFEVQLSILGEHNARNALAATAVALAAGVSVESIRAGLVKFQPVSGRMQVKPLKRFEGRGIVIDDTYNANPDSVRAAVDVLATLKGQRWLALGDMGEVGSNGPAFHREVGIYARDKGIDYLFATGELSAESVAGFNEASKDASVHELSGMHFADAQLLSNELIKRMTLLGQSTSSSELSILVKGSRFTKMERVVNNLLEEKSACC